MKPGSLVVDIEANGLNELKITNKGDVQPEATTIHVVCTKDVETGETRTFRQYDLRKCVEYLNEADLLIGHNLIGYDIVVLERLSGCRIDTPSHDTLIVSRLIWPDQRDNPLGGHSLKAWGEYLDFPKDDYDGGWERWSQEMEDYCVRDVEVSLAIYEHQRTFHENNKDIIDLEFAVAEIIARQQANGWTYDLNGGEWLEMTLLQEQAARTDELQKVFPPIVTERWSEKTGKRLKDKVEVFNPASRKQIAERLKEKYGWVGPRTDKGNPQVDGQILKTLGFPEAKILVQHFDDLKLLGYVTDWNKRAYRSRDGKIHSFVNTLGTVTGRMSSSQPNLQQVSSDKRARMLFGPRKGWIQVGIDASGLEARMLANRMWEYDDGEYAKIVLDGDIHALNMEVTGIKDRATVKRFFYGFLYGAGDPKLAEILDCGIGKARATRKRFLDGLPALAKTIEACKWQSMSDGKILLLDGRRAPCRSEHTALNVQLQGDGAVVMKAAQVRFNDWLQEVHYNWDWLGTIHDEWQLEVEGDQCSIQVGIYGVQALEEAGRTLNVKIPLDGEYKIGRNWSECH